MTAIDVAKWMVKELDEQEFLYPEWAVWEIQEIFGDDFVSENENGNLTISKVVLKEFRKLTEGEVVWMRSEKAWRRLYEDENYEGRQQTY
ncbi:TPA: hypothetical protein JH159_003381 [Acinetobacter baumannii]|uniref:DUF6953 family protein n=1 Tax=Acinetobacter baumannii TaxID=470 RepID=UPI000CF313DD|nr:hypothetical protein [Acinetobacter baumannii]EKX4934343.1 hypothetical protein [Acinetobacter baumannii]PQI87354.1 hypothetical protein C5U11_14260 [Acinetobacter baumannii]HAV2729464.1 hypothetical protein [Acinetobacter baumannii]HCQ9738277.1 hypothetical protein [Acinetobacter baumannii]